MFALFLPSLFALLLAPLDLASANPVRGLARAVQSDLILLERVKSHGQNSANLAQNDIPMTPSKDVPAGEALDIFYRYGFFSLSVRVVPRDDPGRWLIREPTAAIFQENSVQQKITKGSNSFPNNIEVHLCDDIAELQKAYFQDFTADGVEEPSKLFTGSWHSSTQSKYLGLSKEIFEAGDSSFVLLKMPKTRITYTVVDEPSRGIHPLLKAEARKTLDSVTINDPDSVLDFVSNYGSHYIQRVSLGDVIYQVIALTPQQYSSLKADVGANGFRPKMMSQAEFSGLYNAHLAPWNVKESGKVLAASGDVPLLSFLDEKLVVKGQFGTYPSLLQLQKEPSLQDELESLSASSPSMAVVGLHFSALRTWVNDIQVRDYYDQIVDTQTALWEVNIARK